MERKKKLRLKKSVKITLIAILGVVIALLLGILIYRTFLASPVRKKVEVEAGETLDITMFVKKAIFRNSQDYTFKEDVNDYMNSVGEHDITILKGEHEYHSQLSVIDTTPPVATAKTAKGYTHHKVKPNKLVKDVQDATSLTYAYKEDPDYELEGEQDVVVIITDEGGNEIEVESKLNLDVDVTDPVIKGAKNLVVVKDSKVNYKKGVSVTDNVDKDLKITVDDSKVKLDTVGSYDLTYTATDLSGNSATKTVTVNVVLKDLKDSTTEDVYAEIDPILKKIYKQSDSQRKKALAIYNYVKSNVGYESNKIKGPWQYGAMYALKNGKGNAYCFFSLSKAMLTRAGIKTMDLSASKKTKHYWNFVQIKGKWYHFDASPHDDHPYLFLRTDEWITEYSEKNKLCFKWDQKKKPASAKKDG